ncbi:MAG: hypothetical protein FJ290_06465 [Planctomycetes bacterium]|nr:hypothetical protein [Planctomycetota bacterium]
MSGIPYAQLSLMMFLQLAIWAAWAPGLPSYLSDTFGLSGRRTRGVCASLCFAYVLSPLLGGQIADRWLATEHALAAAHLAGGALLLAAAHQRSFRGLFALLLLHSLVYAPTLALAPSLMFRYLTRVADQAGGIRVWGAVGWLVAGWAASAWRGAAGRTGKGYAGPLVLAGGLSLLMAAASLFLPHTPPLGRAADPLACRAAVALLAHPNVLIFLLIAVLVSSQARLHEVSTEPFLRDIGVRDGHVPGVTALPVAGEVIGLAVLLPLLLPGVGHKWALAIGILAWPACYIVCALLGPRWLVLSSLPLRGLGCALFFFAGQIYVDSVARPDIKASAQALITVATLGLGDFLGTQFAGMLMDFFKFEGKFRWRPIFLVPCILTVACAIAFLALFKG